MMLLAVFLACEGPLDQAWSREASWASLDRLEAESGLQLTRLSAGDAVGRWPRIVVKMDGIDLDNRAFVLSLGLPEAQAAGLLVDQPQVLTLKEGALQERQRTGMGVDELRAPLKALLASNAEAPAPPPAALLIIPDARLPAETLKAVMHTALQAGFKTVTPAGRVGDHLRTPLTRSAIPFGQCRRLAIVDQSAAGVLLQVGASSIGPVHGGCDRLPPSETGPALRGLAKACYESWPGFCFDVVHAIDDDVRAGEVLSALSSTWAVDEPLRQGPLSSLLEGSRDCSATLGLASLDAAAIATICTPEAPAARRDPGELHDLFDQSAEDSRQSLDDALKGAAP